jgi:glycosyltransferase involved in cell wall biosynthesis
MSDLRDRASRSIFSKDFRENVLFRNLPFQHTIVSGPNRRKTFAILALIRVRNEEILLPDTLDHLATFADGIIVFDDASTDDTALLAQQHPQVVEVIRNKRWRSTNRIWEETANRRKLAGGGSKRSPQWIFYADADERFEGDIRSTLLSHSLSEIQAVRVSLLDSYLTRGDQVPYTQGQELLNFRKFWGPERRDIIMAWRPSRHVQFFLPDSREPVIARGGIRTMFWCQHYGKSISVAEWEATCDYYATNFPPIYAEKWAARKGRAIHERSDFGAPLYSWADAKRVSYLL